MLNNVNSSYLPAQNQAQGQTQAQPQPQQNPPPQAQPPQQAVVQENPKSGDSFLKTTSDGLSSMSNTTVAALGIIALGVGAGLILKYGKSNSSTPNVFERLYEGAKNGTANFFKKIKMPKFKLPKFKK